MRVLGLCGSLQTKSSNRTLMEVMRARAPLGLEISMFEGLPTLPHFNPELEADGTLPEVDALRSAVAAADALLIACPEYGFSLPGVLKTAVDWLIGTGELERKRIAITAAVAGPERGLRGIAALRDTLTAVSAEVVFAAPIVRGGDAEAQISAVFAALLGPQEASQ